MKKLYLIIFVFLCAGCESSHETIMSFKYYKDESTQICFAGRYIGAQSGLLTEVPCTDLVMKRIEMQEKLQKSTCCY